MKDVGMKTVKDGKRNLDKMLAEMYGNTYPKTVRGVWIDYTSKGWKEIVECKTEIVSLAEKQGINLKFDETRRSINFRYR